MPELSLGEIIAHPASKATALVGVLGGVLKLPLLAALWAGLWGQLGTLFTVTSIFGFTVAPQVSFVPTEGSKVVALVAAGLFATKKLIDAGRGIRKRLNKQNSDT